MTGIFISYRRDDSAFVCGLIHDRLSEHFGPNSIFTDVESIPLGVNFKEYIDAEVAKCDIFLTVIGEKWLTVFDGNGRPRLESTEDFVRLEVESALDRDIPVIPVLIGDVTVPLANELPEPMRELSLRNGASIRPKPSFDADVELLIRGIEKHLDKQTEADENYTTPGKHEQAVNRRIQKEEKHRVKDKDSEHNNTEEFKPRLTQDIQSSKSWRTPVLVVCVIAIVAIALWYAVVVSQENRSTTASLPVVGKRLTSDQLRSVLVGNTFTGTYFVEGEFIKFWEYFDDGGDVNGEDEVVKYLARYEFQTGGCLYINYNDGDDHDGCYYFERSEDNKYNVIRPSDGTTWIYTILEGDPKKLSKNS